MRQAAVERTTKETKISCSINVDGTGENTIETGIGFFDHMMQLLSFHSGMDLTLKAEGDLQVDDHHTIEDCGIVLGQAFRKAIGDAKGIARYGNFSCVMDEALGEIHLDISNRPYVVFQAEFTREKVGEMATEMVEEFMRGFAVSAGITLHVLVPYGKNDHHKIEAIFKALGHALNQATRIVSDQVPSSKGILA